MTEAERPGKAPEPDNDSFEGEIDSPQELKELIRGLPGLTLQEKGRLMRSALGILSPESGVFVPRVFDEAVAANPDLLLKAVRSGLAEHIVVRDPSDYDVMLLVAAQSHLRSILPEECCVSLAFVGSKSSGKTTATKIVTKLAGGRFFAGGSQAALRDLFGGGLVGLDEVDTQSRRLEDLEGILRTGSAWNATYPIKVFEGNRWEIEERNIGGPKVFNFRGKVDDALLSRCVVVNLPRQRGGRLVVNSLFPDNPILPLSGLIRRVCEIAIRGLVRAESQRRMKDPAFIARLDRLPPGLPRGQQTGAILLLISDLLGLGLDSKIESVAAAQAEADEEYDELAGWLREFYESRREDSTMPDLEVLQAALLESINGKRRLAGTTPWSPTGSAFKTGLRELGFEDGRSLIRHRNGRVVIFDADVRKRLGFEAEPTTPASTTPSPDPGDLFNGLPTKADNARSRLETGFAEQESEMDRAVRTLGPTITYPDGTVRDRRTGALLRKEVGL